MFLRSRFASLVSGAARIAALFGLLLLAAPGFSQGLPRDARLSISANGMPVVRNGASSSTIQLSAAVVPPDASNKGVQWSSSNPAVASVDGNGLVTAVGAGTATITVRSFDGSFTDQCAVTVELVLGVSSVTVNPSILVIGKGDTKRLVATVEPPNVTDSSVSCSSSNPTVASITNGMLTALEIGSTTITVRTNSGNRTAQCSVTVTALPPVPVVWKTASVGVQFSIAIAEDGTLWAWGGIWNGSKIPSRVGSDTDWASVSGQYMIKENGTLWMFSGQSVVRQGVDSDWAQVSCGDSHILLLKTDGSLWASGSNGSGQLGLGHNNAASWARVGTANHWVSVAAGNNFSLAIATDGDRRMIYGWGANNVYQLGLYPIGTANKNVPTFFYRPSYANDDWNLIAAGGSHSMAIRNNGTLWTWGHNYYGQTGMAAYQDEYTMYHVQIGANAGAGTWVSVAGNSNYTLAVNSDGSLWYTGGSTTHQGLQKAGVDNDWAVCFASSQGSCGHFLAMKKDGSLWSWGVNNQGQLGHGDTVAINMPKKIGL